MTNAPKTFREAYSTLQRHAETLRSQRDPDLDNLLTIVTESVTAYQVCKTRIDAVEKALEEALGASGLDSGGVDEQGVESVAPAENSRTRPAPAPKSSTGFEDMDDDMPF